MKLVRFRLSDETVIGEFEGGYITCRTGSCAGDNINPDTVDLLCPVTPTKIVAVGLNYKDHAQEMGEELPETPLLFMKPASSVIGPKETIILPPQSQRVDYEAELAVVIGQTAKNVASGQASEYIMGYTCLNDVTARDLQKTDGQWTRAKGFDTFCPIGPWIETEFDFAAADIKLSLNGEIKQSSNTSNLIFNPYELVEFISSVMTLYAGDVIATGTSSGIGPMNDGDTVEVQIAGIGRLTNIVRKWHE
jgi:2-keto-4-pentenoate hydratase/2-oxohepta-3-ene-1,7-dioic acid hydratase in catechol pathway